jgi:EAL domain-containing protein (putative c-di-GMP-specific phosphodiesterase class I)
MMKARDFSRAFFLNKNLMPTVIRALAASQLPAHRLEFEISSGRECLF